MRLLLIQTLIIKVYKKEAIQSEKLGTTGNGIFSKVGAVLSECDGYDKHIPKLKILKAGQVVKSLQIANYYYPSDQEHLYVPQP